MAAHPIPRSVAGPPVALGKTAEPAAERGALPLEPQRRRLRERSALERLGPLFAGPAAPPHGEHHSPYR